MTSSNKEEIVLRNIEVMNSLQGFDVVIVSCSSSLQAKYWQGRLSKGKGSVLPLHTNVFAVEEDWPGGAGNALGTLYAYQKAVAVAITQGIDISKDLLAKKISVGLFHTAGKGTRLAPLPGAENNNKPGVKLPAMVSLGGIESPITILEAVVKQSGSYANSRKGRLSVFWGDQIFIPTVPTDYNITHHIDILCSLGPMLSEAEWKEKGMDKYGLIARSSTGGAAQVEKVDHATAVQLLSNLGEIESVGASLGSFSISSLILFELLNEFSAELAARSGKYDTDPHLWMPLTLEKSAYVHLMKQKGVDETTSNNHHDRMALFRTKFDALEGAASLGLFGPVDVGQGVYWWDYGQLKLYQNNTLLLTQKTADAELLKLFFGLTGSTVRNSNLVNTSYDDTSIISSSALGSEGTGSGAIKASIVSNVHSKFIDAEGAILINVTAERIIAKPGSIVYNIIDSSVGGPGLVVEAGQVLAGVFSNDGTQHVVKSTISIDGGKAWEKIVEGNPFTFEQVYNSNSNADPTLLEQVAAASHGAAWARINA